MREIWDEEDFCERENFLYEKEKRQRQRNCKGKLDYCKIPNFFHEA